MKTEPLVGKGVKHHFNGKETVFQVESLHEHFEGLQIHKTDISYVEQGELVVGYVKEGDVDFANAVANEVAPKEDIIAMTYEEADKLLKIGGLVALPEWEGFWFNDIKTGETFSMTNEGEIVETMHKEHIAEYMEHNDWIKVEATEEQGKLLDVYFTKKSEGIEVVDEQVLIIETPAPKKKKKK